MSSTFINDALVAWLVLETQSMISDSLYQTSSQCVDIFGVKGVRRFV